MSRYPLADLLEATRLNVSELARRLGVERTQIYRWKEHGLTFEAAERSAETLGFVPYEIWPAWLGESADRAHEASERKLRTQREASARWRARHPERARAVALGYRHRHIERVRERDRSAIAAKRLLQAKLRHA